MLSRPVPIIHVSGATKNVLSPMLEAEIAQKQPVPLRCSSAKSPKSSVPPLH